jgi:hypothetical protein
MLSDDDLLALRRLLDKAGSETALRREVKRAKQLPKGRPGRPRAHEPEVALMYFEMMCRVFERLGIKRNTTLWMLVHRNPDKLYGQSAKSAVHRIAARLRDPEFAKKFTEERLSALAKEYPLQFHLAQSLFSKKEELEPSETEQRALRNEWKGIFAKILQGKR